MFFLMANINTLSSSEVASEAKKDNSKSHDLVDVLNKWETYWEVVSLLKTLDKYWFKRSDASSDWWYEFDHGQREKEIAEMKDFDWSFDDFKKILWKNFRESYMWCASTFEACMRKVTAKLSSESIKDPKGFEKKYWFDSRLLYSLSSLELVKKFSNDLIFEIIKYEVEDMKSWKEESYYEMATFYQDLLRRSYKKNA